MANTTAPSPGSAPPSCLHSPPSFCSTSSDEETDNLQWPTCFRTHIHPDWMIKGVTSVKRRRIPVRHDALLIRLLPVFLPPREAPHHRDFVNLPLEGSSCLLPVNIRTGRPVAPTFWVRHVPTCRISPQDPSVTRLIIWLLNWQFEEWVATWGYIPDFLFKWEEPRRRLTVFPLVSVLLEPHFPHQTAFDLAVSTTYPIIDALQTPPHLNKFEALDIAPLLCFLLGQWCQFETIQSFSFSKEVWRMVLPNSLEQQHWQYIQRVNNHWRTLYRTPSLDTSLCDFISHIIDTRAAEFTTTTHTEHQPQPLLLSDWQVVPPCHIQILTLSMDSVECGYCAMVPFFMSLLHLHRVVPLAERVALTPSSTVCWFRHQLGYPWMISKVSPTHPVTYEVPRISPSRHVPRLGGLYTTTCIQCSSGSFATIIRLPLADKQADVPNRATPASESAISGTEGATPVPPILPQEVEQSLLEGGVLSAEKTTNLEETTNQQPKEPRARDVPQRPRKRGAPPSPSRLFREEWERRVPRSPRSARSGVSWDPKLEEEAKDKS